MYIFSVLMLVGGLSMFLFGMNYMGDSLKKLSGSRFESVLGKLTSSRFKGFFLGLGITAVIQSSSAVMVMLVGFVNSGIMALAQTTGILMGANIGTTVTAWLLSSSGISGDNIFLGLLKPSSFTPLLAAAGVGLTMLSKTEKKKNLGSVFIGFAILMFGMETMSGATESLQDSAFFSNLLIMFSNPVMGISVGTVFTAIIQSSSASVGILQAFSLTNNIPVSAALPIILGMNIGAAVPPVLSAISGNASAKRVAASCVYIKIIGVAVVSIIFYLLNALLHFGFLSYGANVFTIAVIHTTFNIVSTLILMPFCRGIEKLSELTFKGKADELDIFASLDNRFLSYPAFALEKAKELTVGMTELSSNSIYIALSLLEKFEINTKETVDSQEKTVDRYEDKLSTYLVALSGKKLTAVESAEITTLLHIIGDVERISDHASNIAKTSQEMFESNIILSDNAQHEIKIISDAIKEILTLSVSAVKSKDYIAAIKVEPLKKIIKQLQEKMKDNHILRLQSSECSVEVGFVFADLLTNFVRIADHCSNIAVYLLQQESSIFSPHEYEHNLKRDKSNDIESYYDMYHAKYMNI